MTLYNFQYLIIHMTIRNNFLEHMICSVYGKHDAVAKITFWYYFQFY